MIFKIENGIIYRDFVKTIFYIPGGNSGETDCCIEQKGKKMIRDLRERGFYGFSFYCIEQQESGERSPKALILRNNPSLTPEEVEKFAKRTNCEPARLFCTIDIKDDMYSRYCKVLAVEREFYEGDNIDDTIEQFLNEVVGSIKEIVAMRREHDTRIFYRMPDIEPPLLDISGNLELLATELLAENYDSGACRLSPMVIDENFNILLPRYPQIEITLEALPKALYILFLLHPEGIHLKNIRKYSNELRHIYSKVSGRHNPSVVNKLIDAITNPYENNLYNNIYLIRQAFLDNMAAELAIMYIPTWGRGTAQLVALDRDMVSMPDDLIFKEEKESL